ncbi:hypothetical protein [Accumulibacter sp.]|uniref:hypothetical protein n=1 Tax=Accumulibacter sp. TaxID=2053492 RepID=UPI0025F58834|nr:hypothetical protein [Accumulibacter sp.]MCP5228069.1 hypothetical protein [Accumulibacter sp.]
MLHGANGLVAAYGCSGEFTMLASRLATLHARERERFRAVGHHARQTTESRDWRHVAGELEARLSIT